MNKKFLSQTLIHLRNNACYKQQFVADYLSIARQTYSCYETGRLTPGNDTLCRLAALYHIPQDYLINLALPEEFRRTEICIDRDAYIDFITDPKNRSRYKGCTIMEKKMLCYYSKLDSKDQERLMEIAKVLSRVN